MMGVSGCGKSAVGSALARRIGATFLDADDFHSASNVAKMKAGIPLQDEDRWPWIEALAAGVKGVPGDTVVAFSALKQRYRDRFRELVGDYRLVFLDVSPETAHSRVEDRRAHFMPATLVASQFDALERPSDAFVVSAELPIDEIVDEIALELRKR